MDICEECERQIRSGDSYFEKVCIVEIKRLSYDCAVFTAVMVIPIVAAGTVLILLLMAFRWGTGR
jgi:hypothetical protein